MAKESIGQRYRKLPLELQDDFSPAGIMRRWETGYADTMRALTKQPWIGEFGPLDGVVLHEPMTESQSVADQPSLEEVGTPQEHAASAGRQRR